MRLRKETWDCDNGASWSLIRDKSSSKFPSVWSPLSLRKKRLSLLALFNPLRVSVSLIKKPVNWLAMSKSVDWFLYEGNTGTKFNLYLSKILLFWSFNPLIVIWCSSNFRVLFWRLVTRVLLILCRMLSRDTCANRFFLIPCYDIIRRKLLQLLINSFCHISGAVIFAVGEILIISRGRIFAFVGYVVFISIMHDILSPGRW